jgi:hypothetical protein
MSRYYLLIFALFLISYSAKAINIEFEKIMKSDTIFFETPSTRLLKCSDGNFLVSGRTRESVYNTKTNVQTIKFDDFGEIKWQNSYRYDGNVFVRTIFEKDEYYDVLSSAEPGWKLMLLRYDIYGNLIIDKIDEDKENNYQTTISFIEMNGNTISPNYLKFGNKIIRVWVKFDEDGNYESKEIIDSLEFDNKIIRYNEKLNKLDDDLYCYRSSILYTDEEGNKYPLRYDFYDSYGNKKNEIILYNDSTTMISGTGNGPVIKTKNNDIILTGMKNIVGSPRIYFIKRYNSNYQLVWEKLYYNHNLKLFKIIEDNNGNILLMGNYYNEQDKSDFCIIVLNSDGKEIKRKTWNVDSLNCSLTDATIINDESIMVSGSASNQIYFAKVSYNPTKVEQKKRNKNLIINNPVNDYLFLNQVDGLQAEKIIIYDLTGNIVYSSKFNYQIDLTNLFPGFYFLQTNNKIESFIKK